MAVKFQKAIMNVDRRKSYEAMQMHCSSHYSSHTLSTKAHVLLAFASRFKKWQTKNE